jgi:hypothetical protein
VIPHDDIGGNTGFFSSYAFSDSLINNHKPYKRSYPNAILKVIRNPEPVTKNVRREKQGKHPVYSRTRSGLP